MRVLDNNIIEVIHLETKTMKAVSVPFYQRNWIHFIPVDEYYVVDRQGFTSVDESRVLKHMKEVEKFLKAKEELERTTEVTEEDKKIKGNKKK